MTSENYEVDRDTHIGASNFDRPRTTKQNTDASLVVQSTNTLGKKQNIEQHDRKSMEQDSIYDDASVDISCSVLAPGQDIMADFGGFLDKRKKDRNMQRNTMMSQIDGLVNNLNSDIDRMMV